jgi:hypothetical protein
MLGITMEADVASFLNPRNMSARTFTNQTETLSPALFSEQIENVFSFIFYFCTVERPDPQDFSTLVSVPNYCHTGDSHSCPPELELGTLTILVNGWLAGR